MRKRHVNSFKATEWMIVDCFAGGGGASTGIEMALGRSPDVAVNHNGAALAMHAANHPLTRHYKTDVREIDPLVVTRNKPVGLGWFSPDCTYFSKSRGGKPMRGAGKKVRGLAWVVLNWARKTRPRVIILENVEEFQDWGPVVKKVGADGFPVFDQSGEPWYVPCPDRRGKTFRKWVRRLQALGGVVEWRELRACDYGSPTIRKRLFVIIRFDGESIVWPEPTHGKPGSAEVIAGMRLPWRTAASDVIDWSIPCQSIFLTPAEAKVIGVKRPLQANTLKRIFAGLKRYVLECAKPFVVYGNHGGDWFRGYGVDQPASTVTCSRDAVGVVDPVLSPFVASPAHSKTTGRGKNVWHAEEPVTTVTTSNDKCVVAPVMTFAQHGGANRPADGPMHTVTASNKDQNAIIAPYCVPRYGEAPGKAPRCGTVEAPLPTIVTTDNGAQVVAPVAQHGGDNRPADGPIVPILDSQYGNSRGVSIEQPLPTVTGGGGGKSALVAPVLDAYHGPKGDTVGRCGELNDPLRTQDTSNRHALVQAFIAQHNGGVIGNSAERPLSTITTRGTQQNVVEVKAETMFTNTTGHGPGDARATVATVTTGQQQGVAAAYLSHMYGSNTGGGAGNPDYPAKTVTAGGQHHAAVMAFLAKYYGNHHNHQGIGEPLHTATTKERFGIVTVNEVEYQIVDIGMRMLTARELFNAQGFPRNYKIEVWCDERRNKDGKLMKPGILTKEEQVRCAGNSVCPQLAAALVSANCGFLKVSKGKRPQLRNRQLELKGV